jgi:hypothetical protein
MDHQVKEEKRMQRGFTGGHTYDPDGKTKYLPKYIHNIFPVLTPTHRQLKLELSQVSYKYMY